VRPVQDETTQSFVHRLAQANHIRNDELADYLIPRLAGSQGLRRRFETSLHALAAVSALDAVYLAQALPDIRSQFTDQDSLHLNRTQLACRRCMAAKNITTRVIVWARHDHNVCLRHQLWISQGVNKPEDQADVADLPEITQSQVRHHNLIRRYGHRPVNHCYWTAQQVIDWSSNLPSPTARWERKRYFFTREKAEFLPWSYDFAAYYPEVIGVLSVLLSPYWRRMAISDDPAEEQRFYRQIAANGLTNGTPAHNTPLSTWVNRHRQDSKSNEDPDSAKFMNQESFGLSEAVQPRPRTGPNPHTKLPQIKWQADPSTSAI
jgi:hypothetical protein